MSAGDTITVVAHPTQRTFHAGMLCRSWSGRWRGVIVTADFEHQTLTFERLSFWRWWGWRLRNLWWAVRNEWRSVTEVYE